MKDTCTIWVCQDCILHHANGECGGCHYEWSDYAGHDREPLTLVDDTEVTMGMLRESHRCGKEDDTYGVDEECECEIRHFSWSSCEGCGSTLGGERHAMTLWFEN